MHISTRFRRSVGYLSGVFRFLAKVGELYAW